MFQGGKEVVYCYEGGEGRANVEQGVCRKHCSGTSYTILHCKDFVKCFGHKLMFDNILKLFSDNCRACVHRDISVVVVIS